MHDDTDPMELTKHAFTHLTQQVSADDLRDLFQIVVGEMYIRSDSDDDFAVLWTTATDTVFEMFNPETCPVPEILQGYIDAREELLEAKTRRFSNVSFEQEAVNDLERLFNTHGVIEEDTPPDDTPGLYL